MQKGLNKWLEREEGSDDKKKKKTRGRGKKQRRQQNASLCLLAVELLFEMKIQSVWGITVDWQARGSQAVICTPVIWSMVIIAVCVCVCVLLWSGNSNKHTMWSIKKKKAFSRLTTSSSPPPQNLIFLFFTLSFLPSHWVTSLSLSFSSPSLPPFHPYISPLRSFIPATRAEKPRRHAPSVLRGSNFRFVSDFRLMSVFWLVV